MAMPLQTPGTDMTRNVTMTSQPAPLDPQRRLVRGQTMDFNPAGPAPAGLWQLTHGLLLVGHHDAADGTTWHLALPGDWLDLEQRCGLQGPHEATALTRCHLRRAGPDAAPAGEALLRQLLAQQRRWSRLLLGLRSGPVTDRVQHLLDLAGSAAWPSADTDDTAQLPTLRDLAALVDAAPETVCRALTRLRPGHAGRRGGRRPAAASVPRAARHLAPEPAMNAGFSLGSRPAPHTGAMA